MTLFHHAKDISLSPALHRENHMLFTNIQLVSPLDGTMYGCPECGLFLPSIENLKKHMQTSHSKAPAAVCKICHKKYQTVKSLRRHEKTHLKNVTPVTVKEKELQLPCPQCPKKFSTQTALHWHIQRNHTENEKTNTCQVCGKELANHALLKRHLETVHSLETATCSICNKTFKSATNLQRHVAVTHPPEQAEQTCTICNKTFKCSTHLRIHIRAVHTAQTVFKCDICTKEFPLKSYLLKHRKTHVDIKEFQCEICYQVYKTAADARRHAKRVHMKTEESKKMRGHKCNVCDKEFTRTKYLFFHKKTHVHKTLSCKFCSKLFKCTSHVNKHTKRVHSKSSEEKIKDIFFYCDTCNKSFSKKKNLAKHIKIHIFMKKETPCGICNKLFKTNSDVNKHLRKVHMKNMNIKDMIIKNKNMKNIKRNAFIKTNAEETRNTKYRDDDGFRNAETVAESRTYTVNALEITEYTNEVPRGEDYSLATLGSTYTLETLESTEYTLEDLATIGHTEVLETPEHVEKSPDSNYMTEASRGKILNEEELKITGFTNGALETISSEATGDRTNIKKVSKKAQFVKVASGNIEVIGGTNYMDSTERECKVVDDSIVKAKLHRSKDIIKAAIESSDFTMEDLGMSEKADLNAGSSDKGLRSSDLIPPIGNIECTETPEDPECKQKLRNTDIIKAAIEISDFSMEDLGIADTEDNVQDTGSEKKFHTNTDLIKALENTGTTEDFKSIDSIEVLDSSKILENTDIIRDTIENSNFTIEDLGLTEYPEDVLATEYTIEDFGITEYSETLDSAEFVEETLTGTDFIAETLSSTDYGTDARSTELTVKTIGHPDFIDEALASTEYTKEVPAKLHEVLENTEFTDQALDTTFFMDVLDNTVVHERIKVPAVSKFSGKALAGTDFIEDALRNTVAEDTLKNKDLIEQVRESIEYAKEIDENSEFMIKTDGNTDVIKEAIESSFTMEVLGVTEDLQSADYDSAEIKECAEVDLKSIEIKLLKCLKCGIDFENDVDLHTHLCGGEMTLFLDF